jgi:hypothetical protein
MNVSVVKKITNSSKRKSLFHFTRVRNLASIAHLDVLYACLEVDPSLSNERRVVRKEIQFHGHVFVANAHLRISDQVMDPQTTHEEFHTYLDQHVFFWPTQRDCLKMLQIYSKREPDEAFAILQLDAEALLSDCYDAVKLSKYDSGSSPRYPNRCSYKKSLQMFLPLNQFEIARENDVPTKPSEIREVLVEEKVPNLSQYLEAIYCESSEGLAARWLKYTQTFQEFKKAFNI